jgi:hypothetical protein
VLGWLYERGLRWILDRNSIRGQVGEVSLKAPSEEEEEEEESSHSSAEEKTRVIDERPPPKRPIYCIDLKVANSVDPFLEEIRRIRDVELVSSRATESAVVTAPLPIPGLRLIEEHPQRRWYPVIDYSRCTNCMECIDFCLFGVYGVDGIETILVEQPDNCRKGCPACSRVCPENAIIFPQHKTPAIAGAPIELGGFKIDLSKLFGAPDAGEDALQAAVRERDEQLILTGRHAVGAAVGLRTTAVPASAAPKDELDRLLDRLDELDL